MASGYEKSPDYGGRPPSKAFMVFVALFYIALFGIPAIVLILRFLG